MEFPSASLQRNWLWVTAIVVGSFGPIFSLATMAAWDEPARWSLDLLAWPLDGVQQYTEGTMRFLTALTGGFLFGWGVMIACLRQWVYDHAPDATRKAVVVGLCAWFVLDSLGSIASGTAINVAFNVAVLLLAVGPLWWSARQVR